MGDLARGPSFDSGSLLLDLALWTDVRPERSIEFRGFLSGLLSVSPSGIERKRAIVRMALVDAFGGFRAVAMRFAVFEKRRRGGKRWRRTRGQKHRVIAFRPRVWWALRFRTPSQSDHAPPTKRATRNGWLVGFANGSVRMPCVERKNRLYEQGADSVRIGDYA